MDDVARREFLKTGVVGLAAATTVGLSIKPSTARAATPGGYPVIEIAALDTIQQEAEISFEYPDPDAPSVLLKLKNPVPGGVGPNKDIVAYSLLCTHKGCPVNYLADKQMLVCPCHWSSFDPAKEGRMIIGQASQSLPQIQLDVENGMVRAVGLNGLIYGRHTNIL